MNVKKYLIAAIVSLALTAISIPSGAAPECSGGVCYYQVCNTAWVNVCYLCQCPSMGFTDHCYCIPMTGALKKPPLGNDGISSSTAREYSTAKAHDRKSARITPEVTKAAELAKDYWLKQSENSKQSQERFEDRRQIPLRDKEKSQENRKSSGQ